MSSLDMSAADLNLTGDPASWWMQTWSGRRFRVVDPDPADVDVEDIGHHLSMLCRYSGAVTRFYSVAEHCVHVASWVETRSPGAGVHGLLHDAAEAYVGDLIRPLKRLLPGYVEIENRVMAAVLTGLGVPAPDAATEVLVKEADNRILLDERAALLGVSPGLWDVDDLEPLGAPVAGWSPEIAEMSFLTSYHYYSEVHR